MQVENIGRSSKHLLNLHNMPVLVKKCGPDFYCTNHYCLSLEFRKLMNHASCIFQKAEHYMNIRLLLIITLFMHFIALCDRERRNDCSLC